MNDKNFIFGLMIFVIVLTAAVALRTDYKPDRSIMEMWVFNYTDNVPVGSDIVVGVRLRSDLVRTGKIELFDGNSRFASFDATIDKPRHYDIEFPAISRGVHGIKILYYEKDLIGKGSVNDPYYITVKVNVV